MRHRLRDRTQVLMVTVGVQALNTWGMLSIAAIAPEVAAGLGVDAILVGYQISLVYSFAMFTAPFAGWLVARWGALRTSQISLIASSLGAGLAALGWLESIVLASILIGFGYGLVNPASSHLLFQRTSEKDRSLVFSIKQTGVPLGGVIAGLVTPVLALVWGWQMAILFTLPLALILVLALQPLREEWDADRDTTPRSGLRIRAGAALLWKDPSLRGLSLGAFCFTTIQLSLVGFCVAFAVTELEFGLIAAGILLAVIQATGVLARLAMGWMADRLGDNAAIMIAAGWMSGGAALGFFLFGPQTPVSLVFLVAIIYSIGAIGWNGVFLAEVARRAPPGQIGAVTGMANVLTFGGVVVGPAFFVLMHGIFDSYGFAFLVLMVPALLGAVLVQFGRRASLRKTG
jgi:MFS family permease